MLFGKFNKKVLLGLLTMVLVFAIIVVSSFFPFIIDPSRIGTTQFITDQLIIIAITISSTISMMFVAQAGNSADEKSELARARVEFKQSMDKIVNRTSLYQWITKIFQPKDKLEIAKDRMERLGIAFKYYELDNYQLKTLIENAQKIDDNFYRKLTTKEYDSIIAIKKQITNIRFVKPNYYTSVSSIDSTRTLSEIASKEGTKKILIVLSQLFARIFSVLIFSMILASLVRDLSEEGGSTAQLWMTFMSRMFSFGSSSFLGYMIGCKLNDLDAFYIRKRIEVHILYLEDKTFKYVDEEKEAFKERIRQETTLLIERKEENEK